MKARFKRARTTAYPAPPRIRAAKLARFAIVIPAPRKPDHIPALQQAKISSMANHDSALFTGADR
jgi:hypothetical protein